ncbi:hypothetical protein NPIL_202101 [Nephila pilipes]|uniref:Uncharacterized protein n=1 Tax=Nephila pilipes TaxID=299642 RepID=A0A8X6P8I6_NEPPI|nr:hypothetical protein NPIL_202101 [Nephila pilipes]
MANRATLPGAAYAARALQNATQHTVNCHCIGTAGRERCKVKIPQSSSAALQARRVCRAFLPAPYSIRVANALRTCARHERRHQAATLLNARHSSSSDYEACMNNK